MEIKDKIKKLKEMAYCDIYEEMSLTKTGKKNSSKNHLHLLVDESFPLRSIAEAFSDSISQKIDPKKLSAPDPVNGGANEYKRMWTNRVAIWWTFHCLTNHLLATGNEIKKEVEDHVFEMTRRVNKTYNTQIKMRINPFDAYGQAFEPIMRSWDKKIRHVADGVMMDIHHRDRFKEEIMSLAKMGFLHALFRHGLDILGSPSDRGIQSFTKKLEYSVKTEVSRKMLEVIAPFTIPQNAMITFSVGSVDDLAATEEEESHYEKRYVRQSSDEY